MFVPDIQCLAWTTDGLAKPLIDARSHLKSIKFCLRDFTKAFRTGRRMDRPTDGRTGQRTKPLRPDVIGPKSSIFRGQKKKKYEPPQYFCMQTKKMPLNNITLQHYIT